MLVDFRQTNGVIRALHGVNKGPLAPGGLIDLTDSFRALKIPFIRLHDCHWPNPDVVDIHALFPRSEADPILPSSYDFKRTDQYISAILATGAQIVFRLGESIEHTPDKRHVHPPPDPAKWAAICLGIVRHYNEGWANGFHHNIRYWEIWNEPENRPAMWTGTDDDFFQLYKITARILKSRYPNLKIGGPGVGNSGSLKNNAFVPSAFVEAFLALCQRESLTLDFFSWHCYTANPAELSVRAAGIRQLLDAHGFKAAESHLNEWNYLPDNTWNPILRNSPPEQRQLFYERMAGAEGAAFIISALLALQDAPVDLANLFHGELGAFGLFTEHGVPSKNYYAFKTFATLAATDHRLQVRPKDALPPGLAAAAGVHAATQQAVILLSNFSNSPVEVQINLLNQPASVTSFVERIETGPIFPPVRLPSRPSFDLIVAGPSVALLVIRPN